MIGGVLVLENGSKMKKMKKKKRIAALYLLAARFSFVVLISSLPNCWEV
jgi:hypothetical protein